MKKTEELLAKLFLKVFGREIEEEDFSQDIQRMDIDSISYIQFLAEVENEFEIEFEYDAFDKMKVVSIDNISAYICKNK